VCRFVSYLRVSTAKQGHSGLGLEAQRAAVATHVATAGTLLAEYVEIESGKRSDRPEMLAALARCKLTGATLLVAKLDRLSRDAAFLLRLRDSGVEFVCADMPHANRLTVGIMALVAEQEREAISTRTKAALAAAKARGKVLGGWRGGPRADVALMHKASRQAADAFAERVLPIASRLRDEGQSLSAIAAHLTAQGVLQRRGGTNWTAQAVKNLLARRS
jgi:DNA invertase Pin-like site-specific DNA recombinase